MLLRLSFLSKHIEKKIIPVAILFTCSYAQKICAQDTISNIPGQWKQYTHKIPQEKVFIHTDKSFYLAGEILWFKAYTINSNSFQPTAQSKVTYVEVLDSDNKPVMQAKIGLKKGQGNGSFYLPASIGSGNYRLRAYTNWMKNFDPGQYFEKAISIVNSLKVLPVTKADTSVQYTVNFYPEGGNLVKDAESKVAFEVTDRYGKGMDCKGVILGDKNDTITSFQSLRFGMGHFMLTPNSTKQYKAFITLANGRQLVQSLPAIQEQGYTLQLQDNDVNAVTITVITKGIPTQSIFLFAHARQEVLVAEQGALQNGIASFKIDKNKLADGVSTITVFNDQQQPVCERLYFKKPAQVLSVTANSNAAQYGLRKRVDLFVKTSLPNQQNIPANLSLAVYRIDSLQSIDASSILSYLWLTSELKGNIESPAYYFSGNTAAVKEATDNLLLVHGWRRFNWDNIVNNKQPVFDYAPEFDGHIITCSILHKNEPAAKGIGCYLSVPGTLLQFYNSKTDNSGKVLFDVRNYYGQNELIVQTDAPDSTWRAETLSPFSEKYNATPLPTFKLITEATLRVLNEHHVGMQLVNSFNADKLSQFNLPAIDSLPFYGHSTGVYKLDDYTRFTTMEEVLREYVPQVAVRRNNGHMHLKVFNNDKKSFYEKDPLILLDGVKINSQALMGYDPLKINRLDVVDHAYMKGEFVYDGIVNFTTYHGDVPDLKLDSRAVIIDYEGLQLKREFYSPVYKTEEQALSRIPDFRNLLYWQPDVQTDSNGKAAIELYTSDIKGRYVAVLQGMDEQGHAGNYYFTFEVAGK